MDFSVPEEIRALCGSIERFMDDFVYPLERSLRWRMEATGPAYPPEIRTVQQRAKALGYWAFHLPAEAGGAGIPFMHYAHVNEILGRTPFAPACFGSQAPDSGNAEILWRFGDAEQKKRWSWPGAFWRTTSRRAGLRSRGRLKRRGAWSTPGRWSRAPPSR